MILIHDRNSIDRYSSEAAKLVSCLLKFLAIDMGVEPESFLEIFRGQPQSMRMTYYPPCRQADKVVGLSPHTDRMGLTLLLQANDVQGLQIRKDGKWIAINALDGAFIVNIGDTLEEAYMTSLCIMLCEHRCFFKCSLDTSSWLMMLKN